MKNIIKRKNRIFWMLLAVMLIFSGISLKNDGGLCVGGTQSVQAASRNVVVRFWSSNGKKSYNQLRVKVNSGK